MTGKMFSVVTPMLPFASLYVCFKLYYIRYTDIMQITCLWQQSAISAYCLHLFCNICQFFVGFMLNGSFCVWEYGYELQ